MLDLPTSFIRPAYGEASIAEIPATIGAALGVPDSWAGPHLDVVQSLLDRGPYARVVMFLIDGFGWDRWSEAGAAPSASLRERVDAFEGIAAQLTSVAPSTTATATTTLLGDGGTPASHGLLGYTTRLPSLGLIANLLFWRPEYAQQGVGSLEAWGVRPETFLPRPSLFEVLGGAGISSRVVMPKAIAGSPLSRAQMKGAVVSGSMHLEDALVQVDQGLASATGSMLAYVYLDEVDGLGHRDGPGGGAGRAVVRALFERIGAWVDDVASAPGPPTLVLITADHGHVTTDPAALVAWSTAPDLALLSSSLPGGEPRHVYLYARTGALDELLAGSREAFGEHFAVVAGARALEEGLYGPPDNLHPEARARIGDVVLLARGGATFWIDAPDDPPLGMHGSLEPGEMLVPLVAFGI